VLGLEASHAFGHDLGGLPARSEVGLQLRHDRIRVGLFDTVARQITATTRDDDVRETHGGPVRQTAIELAPWLRAIVGVRADRVRNRVDSRTLPANGGRAARHAAVAQALAWSPARSRRPSSSSTPAAACTATTPAAPPRRRTRRPATRSTRCRPWWRRAGWNWARAPRRCRGCRVRWRCGSSTSIPSWSMSATPAPPRPVGQSTRRGVEWNNRWIPTAVAALRRRPGLDACALRQRRPHPQCSSTAWPRWLPRCATLALVRQPAVALPGPRRADRGQQRALAVVAHDQPARGLPHHPERRGHAGRVQPVRPQVNDIQYFYESQLPGEAAPVADRHVHPAEPRTVRLTLQLRF
jgi:hypothetical protein